MRLRGCSRLAVIVDMKHSFFLSSPFGREKGGCGLRDVFGDGVDIFVGNLGVFAQSFAEVRIKVVKHPFAVFVITFVPQDRYCLVAQQPDAYVHEEEITFGQFVELLYAWFLQHEGQSVGRIPVGNEHAVPCGEGGIYPESVAQLDPEELSSNAQQISQAETSPPKPSLPSPRTAIETTKSKAHTVTSSSAQSPWRLRLRLPLWMMHTESAHPCWMLPNSHKRSLTPSLALHAPCRSSIQRRIRITGTSRRSIGRSSWKRGCVIQTRSCMIRL